MKIIKLNNIITTDELSLFKSNYDNILKNLLSILPGLKSTLYYNNNEYMKIDYKGHTTYSIEDSKYIYCDEQKLQHMYFDDFLSTFTPCIPYQDPFESVVSFKMPLGFDKYNWSKQQLLICQDFVWGDGQNDHSAMCPSWYNNYGMQWGGNVLNEKSIKGNVVKYKNTSYPLIITDNDIEISYGDTTFTMTYGINTYAATDTTKTFHRITSLPNNIEDWESYEFIFACESASKVAETISSSGAYYTSSTDSFSNIGGYMSIPSNIVKFIIEPASDYSKSNPKVYLKEKESGKYLTYESKNFVLSGTNNTSDYYTLTFSNNNVLFTTSLKHVICYNTSSPRFKIYDASYPTATGGAYMQLYGYEDIPEPEKISPELYWENNISSIDLYVGSNYTNICRSSINSNLNIQYISSDDDIATVDINGRVTILSEGEVTISAYVEETDDYLSETIQYKINAIKYISIKNEYKYIVAFIYPLIRIKDKTDHIYSPLLISTMDYSQDSICTRFSWIEDNNSVDFPIENLKPSIFDKDSNFNYIEYTDMFLKTHLIQLNKTLIGGDGTKLPDSIDDMVSERLKTWTDSDGEEGNIELLDSVLKTHIENGDTIELFTIDKSGNMISCGESLDFETLKSNYNSYKNYISDKIEKKYFE